MAITTTNFIKGRMNKSVDERLLPPGEYVDAMNVRLGATETTEIGAVENTKGNDQLTTLAFDGTTLSSSARCIGAYEDGAEETVYWFVHDPLFGGVKLSLDLIISFNTNNNALRYHVITYNTLNFDPQYLITAVEKIEDLLFFSDGLNPPRKINVTQSYPFPASGTTIDLTIDLDLNVIVQPPGFETSSATYSPLPAPTFELISLPGSENYIQDRFLSFAYRYRYKNNEYSATSLFSNPAFKPGTFKFSIKTFDNEGMLNRFNAVNISFGTGDERVQEIDLLFKDSSTNSIYVIERFDKLENGWADNDIQTFLFTNAKIYSVLGADELLRLYDNVPKKAQALTIMGNRLIYGNYTDGYDITNTAGQVIAMDYSTELVSKTVLQQELIDPQLANGTAYSIDPNNIITATNAVINFDLSELVDKLKTNTVVSFDLSFEHATLSGTTTTDCYLANNTFSQDEHSLAFFCTLTQDYTSVFSFTQSTEFANMIGTVLNTNFQPIATADQGTSLTDKFNSIITPPSDSCSFVKTLSGIDDSTTQQPFRITSSPGSNIVGLQIPAMKFFSVGDPTANPVVPDTELYEYYSIIEGGVQFTSDDDIESLHSNRDFATGIVYMDKYGRSSTVLTSDFNTISIPASNSISANKIKVVLNNYAPSFATKYKFVVKPSKGNYETIFSNFQYTDQTTQVTYFKLEGDNQNKVKTGDILIVKTDTTGPLTSVVKTKVLAVEAEGRNFLSNVPISGNTGATEQLAGLYMQIKASNFQVEIPADSVIEAGRIKRESGSTSRCRARVNYPFFTTDNSVTPATTNNYTIPAGSKIIINIRVNRRGRGRRCEAFTWEWNQEFTASEDYTDARRWWNGDNINPALAVPGAIQADGDGTVQTSYLTQVFAFNGDIPCTNPDGTPLGDNSVIFAWGQDVVGDPTSPLQLIVKTKKPACGGLSTKESTVAVDIAVQRATQLITFETDPVDAAADVFFDASDFYDIVLDGATGNYLHQAPTADGDQSQTTSLPLIVTLPFMDCYTFGNGVESFKIRDDLAGRALKMGQRVLTVSQQDFKEANRFADLTYSGIFSSNAGVNNLNEFNLGLVNFKELETSFGPIQKLHARETDILTLQEDKISYVLASKNLISDSVGGGAIVSTPTILGTQIARVEEYGISFNPESFGVHADNYYFTDTKRVAVIKLTGQSQSDTLEVISEAGMRSWFRDEFQLSLDTQKLGGYDPYMDEYVLSINDIKVPVPPVVYECGSEFQALTVTEPQSYTVDLTTVIGTADVDYNITSGSATVSAVWSGNTFSSGVVSGSGTLQINKTANTPTTAVITVTPSGGSASFTIQPKCVTGINITVVKCVINSTFDGGSQIHAEYKWEDGATISPIDSNTVTLGTNSLIFSFYESQTGVRSQGVYPYDSASLTMRINKQATDNYNWQFPQDNFKFLSSNTLYANTPTDVAALLAAANTIPDSLVTNPTGTSINQTTVSPSTTPAFTLPANNQYLYLIYDLRFTSAQDICYSDTSATEACCDCNIPCDTFQGSTVQSSTNFICSQATVNTYYFSGDGVAPDVGDLVYSNQQCAGNAPGQTINNLAAGFYKIAGNQYIQVNQFGIIINKISC